jgi:hypothetical protein
MVNFWTLIFGTLSWVTNDWWPFSSASVRRTVAQGWNIDESSLCLVSGPASTPLGDGTWVRGRGVVQTRYWVVRLHAAPRLRGVWLVLPDHGALLGDVVGVGLFLENCIVDASIL